MTTHTPPQSDAPPVGVPLTVDHLHMTDDFAVPRWVMADLLNNQPGWPDTARRYLNARAIRPVPAPSTAQADETAPEGEWIEWAGGGNPVPDEVVEYERRDGEMDFQPSNSMDWRHGGPMASDIIAYRLVTPQSAPARMASDAPAEGVGEVDAICAGASDLACHLYPGRNDQKLRTAFVAGVAHQATTAVLAPSPSVELAGLRRQRDELHETTNRYLGEMRYWKARHEDLLSAIEKDHARQALSLGEKP